MKILIIQWEKTINGSLILTTLTNTPDASSFAIADEILDRDGLIFSTTELNGDRDHEQQQPIFPFPLTEVSDDLTDEILDRAKCLAEEYAENGIPGILVVGNPDEILGFVVPCRHNDFAGFEWKIQTDKAFDILQECQKLRERMNRVGITLIDGKTGVVKSNNLFIKQVAKEKAKDVDSGARHSSAYWLSQQCPNATIFVVSEKDNIVFFENGIRRRGWGKGKGRGEG